MFINRVKFSRPGRGGRPLVGPASTQRCNGSNRPTDQSHGLLLHSTQQLEWDSGGREHHQRQETCRGQVFLPAVDQMQHAIFKAGSGPSKQPRWLAVYGVRTGMAGSLGNQSGVGSFACSIGGADNQSTFALTSHCQLGWGGSESSSSLLQIKSARLRDGGVLISREQNEADLFQSMWSLCWSHSSLYAKCLASVFTGQPRELEGLAKATRRAN